MQGRQMIGSVRRLVRDRNVNMETKRNSMLLLSLTTTCARYEFQWSKICAVELN